MVLKCSVCKHPKRAEIDRLLLSGEGTNRSIAKDYGLNHNAVQRHRSRHIAPALVKAKEHREIIEANSVMGDVQMLRTRAIALLDQAESEGDVKLACTALREVRGIIELLAKVSGELETKTEINIIQNNTWIEIRTCVIDALKPYPEARNAVVHALEGR
jgi:hypothetical protein